MSVVDLHNLGTFPSISDVWIAYPEGGHEGDYVYIGSSTTKTYWNKYTRTWGSGAVPDSEVTSDVSKGGIYVGTTLKVAITPSAEGFNIDEDNWWVVVKYGDDDTTYKKFILPSLSPSTGEENMVVSEEGVYFVIIDTTEVSGNVRAIVYVEIKDGDIDPTFTVKRKEVAVVNICRIINP